MSPFELRSLPDEKGKGRLFLVALPYKTKRLKSVAEPTTIARLDGPAIELVQSAIASFLVQAGLEANIAPVFLTSAHALPLDEDTAIRLGLIFNVINSLRSGDRAQAIVDGIAEMSASDAAFWLDKLTTMNADNGRKALIVLLTGAA